LRVVLIGQAAFAEKALEVLHQRGDDIVHVFAPPDVPGGRPDPLKTKAQTLGLPLSQPSSFKGEAVLDHFKSLDADLAVMAFVTIIVPERILFAPRLKTICFHPSLLPRHRGASAINWTLIQGDEESGITWFWPDRGIDTGPILLQRRVVVGPDETTGSLYFNTLFPLGIETLKEAMELVQAGSPPRSLQDESFATYEPICRDEHARIDFTKPARQVYNLIRGCDPQPGAHALFAGRQIRFYEAQLEDLPRRGAPTPPGTILGIDRQALRIALDQAILLVRRIRVEPAPGKISPSEAQAVAFKAGLRFD
jgi:methionyl-tRNA formyltransferase